MDRKVEQGDVVKEAEGTEEDNKEAKRKEEGRFGTVAIFGVPFLLTSMPCALMAERSGRNSCRKSNGSAQS